MVNLHPRHPDPSKIDHQTDMSGPDHHWQDAKDVPAPKITGFQILSRLGVGGMGSVWRAEQLSTKREVALKLMRVEVLDSKGARTRFRREVELAARLDHPNIARIYDSSVNRGAHYYAMELIDGMPLDKFAKTRNLDLQDTLRLVRVVCDAVQHAHRHGVIHCDLKPSNIVVTPNGQPHIVDFGLARALQDFYQDPRDSATRNGELVGTLAYMSPEQAAGHVNQIDTRSDVYALGVILYSLLTGRFPHDQTGSSFDVQRRIVQEEVCRPHDICTTIDRELESLLLKALAKSPSDRYASASDLAHDIDNYLGGNPLAAKPQTVMYLLRKRLRKHLVPVTITMAILTTIITLVANAYYRERILREDLEISKLINEATIRVLLKQNRDKRMKVETPIDELLGPTE